MYKKDNYVTVLGQIKSAIKTVFICYFRHLFGPGSDKRDLGDIKVKIKVFT